MNARTIENLNEVNPRLRRIAENLWPKITAAAAEHDASVTVICGYRSQAEQDRLWNQGRTEPGPIVTWTKRSKHTTREAIDLGIFDRDTGRYLDAEDARRARRVYQEIGPMFEANGCRWGGRWGDAPHVELTPTTPNAEPMKLRNPAPGISIGELWRVMIQAIFGPPKPKN